MLPEGTKTCRLCVHVLWRDEEKEVCLDCNHNWHIIAQAWLEILPNKRLHLTATGMESACEGNNSSGK